RETARLQGFIDRFKAKASKAKQAQSRVKALARMEALAPLHAEAGIDIRIPSPDHMPDPLLTLEHLSAGYTDAAGQAVPILRDVTLMIRAGSRIGVLGANGAGKSTLIKTLAEELPVQAGQRRASRGLAIGYFHQHQLDMLDLDATPLAHLARLAPDTREQELRNYLGGFGFSGEAATGLVGPMSGGEKARLALALIVWQKPNLLLLDEPSNHLDVETREALAAALAEFSGSMLLVSHDRHLLRTTVDTFWIVADGAVHEFDGDLEDYRDWLAARGAEERAADAAARDPAGAAETVNRKAQRRLEAEQRQRLATLRKPLESELAKVEAGMDKTRTALQKLDEIIADADLYSEARRAERQQVLAEHGELGKRMQSLEERWLELQEALEGIQQTG
ncbi:MAG TPA: ATP-binding cassette domain-containing protein, partial [Bordetella sp.]|nr:ATP-binding cassette domain-containing protein [Bordetella sp.]